MRVYDGGGDDGRADKDAFDDDVDGRDIATDAGTASRVTVVHMSMCLEEQIKLTADGKLAAQLCKLALKRHKVCGIHAHKHCLVRSKAATHKDGAAQTRSLELVLVKLNAQSLEHHHEMIIVVLGWISCTFHQESVQ